MPTLRPSIVFFGFQKSAWLSYQEMAFFCESEKEIPNLSNQLTSEQLGKLSDVKIFIVNTKYLNKSFDDFLIMNELRLKQWLWILLDDPDWNLTEWQFLFKNFKILRLIDANSVKDINPAIEEAWSIVREQDQNGIFNQLLIEKNLNLQNEQLQIIKNLELGLANKKNLQNKVRLIEEWGFLLRQSLWIIHRSENLKEVEVLLLDLLQVPLKLKSIEIVISGARPDTIFGTHSVLKITLQSELSDIATLWVSKKDDSIFTSEEKDLFNRLAEALELAISRIKVVEDLGELEQQWQRTFDAIADPVVLTNEAFEIIQTNSAAKNWIAKNNAKESLTCHQALFRRPTPCPECQRDRKFELILQNDLKAQTADSMGTNNSNVSIDSSSSNNSSSSNSSRISSSSKNPNPKNADSLNLESQTFEVSSHRVQKYSNSSFPIYIQLYREITHLKQMEKSLVEQNSQVALGTLSSSIAHELNNPVGGILTLSQLLKMDYAVGTKEHEAFLLVEKKAYDCKEVIETLLEFTHSQTAEPNSECDFCVLLLQGFNLFKTLQKEPFEKLSFAKLPQQLMLQTKPKMLIDLFYLLFAALHKVEKEQWTLSVKQNQSGFMCLINALSKNPIDPQILNHTPLVQYFKSLGFNLTVSDSLLEIVYTSP